MIAIVGLTVGILMGSTAIGGLLLAPGVNIIAGIPLKIAIPACVATFVLTGIVSTTIYTRHSSLAWKDLTILSFGAAPGAFIGAFVLSHLSTSGIQLGIAALAVLSGLYTLIDDSRVVLSDRTTSSGFLIGVGAIVGFLSAVTGTGGPLVLLPILLVSGVPILKAVGLAQAIQIPVGVLATTGNVFFSTIDMGLVTVLGIAVVVGAAVGAMGAQRFSTKYLKTSVAVVLIVVGIGYGFGSWG